MLAKTITSLQHPIVKYFVKLRKESSIRKEHREVVVVGKTLIRELFEKKIPLRILMTTQEEPSLAAQEKYIVSFDILKKVTGLAHPDGFAALVKMPDEKLLDEEPFILILDQVADPGNVGTLFRTALAFGCKGIFLTEGTADPFNEKALRAAKGASFFLPYAWKTKESISAWAENKGVHLYLADLIGEPIESISLKKPFALILSSEAHGAGVWPFEKKISIPIEIGVESLNVASAGAILLFALRDRS